MHKKLEMMKILKNNFLTQDLDEYEREVKHAQAQFNKPTRMNSIFEDSTVRNATCLVLSIYITNLEKIINDISTKYGLHKLKRITSELEVAKKAHFDICEKRN